MILCHEFNVILKPPLVTYNALTITIVKCVTCHCCTMDPKSPVAKRARQDVAGKHTSSSNQSDTPRPSTSSGPKRNPKPHINPKVFRSGDIPRVREETREGKYKDKLCTMCTSGRKPVHHHHFSTSHLRTFAMCWTEGDFMCPVCHKLEPPMQPKEVTKRVILTSSTLFGVWEQHSLPTITQHLEIECIVGGRVRDLTRALKKNLLFLSNRVEIVVVAGINNIGDGQQPNSIVQEMKEMKEVVKQHSQENGHNPPSYVSFSTIILPPTFCSFAVPKDVPE